MIYVLLFAAMCGLRLFVGDSTGNNRKGYYALLVFLFLFAAFRYEVGPDWQQYGRVFAMQQWMTVGDALMRRDPGFRLIELIVDRTNSPYPAVNVFACGIFFGGLHVLARRLRDPLGFLICTFPMLIINMPMSAIRQAAGIGVMCVAFSAFLDRRLIAFAAWTVAAALFHASAIVFLLLLPLVQGQYSPRRLIAAGLLALPGAFALSLTSEAELFADRYLGSDAADGAIYRVGILVVTAAFFLLFTQRDWKHKFPADYRLVHIGSLMMLATFPIILFSTVIADRFAYYLIPIQAIMLTRFPVFFPGTTRQALYLAPYLGLMIVFVTWTQFSWIFKLAYLPYQTWLFGFPAG